MSEYKEWTNSGIWITTDHLLRISSFSAPLVRDLPKLLGERLRQSKREHNYLLYNNAVVMPTKELMAAQSRLSRMMKKEPTQFHGYPRTYELLKGNSRPEEFSIDIYPGEKVEITDTHGFQSSYVSDSLMFLAEKIKLAIPWDLEERWVKQMIAYANRDLEDLDFLAKRDGKDNTWKEEAFVSSLEGLGYIHHLTEPYREQHHITDICERVAQRRKEVAA